jgi:RND family efflux transporter MFP subunit
MNCRPDPEAVMNRVRLALLFAVGAAALVGCAKRPQPGPTGAELPAVTAGHPLVETITRFTDLTGTLAAVKTVDVRPQVSGYIRSVNFKDGSEVKGADVPVEIVPALGGVIGGLAFGAETGDVLVEIDPSLYKADVQKAQADLENAKATYELAKSNVARLSTAFAAEAVSQEEYAQAVSQEKVARANIQSAEAALARTRQNLAWTKVRAPIDGVVDRIYVNKGNLVTGGTAQATILTTIVSADPIYAYFDVDEPTVLFYRRMIEEGKFTSARKSDDVPVAIQLRGETGYPHKGYIDFVSNRLNPATGSLQIRGVFPNPRIGGGVRALMPGLFVRGQIPMPPVQAMLVPAVAITNDQAERAVYVVGKDKDNRSIAQLRTVTLGAQTGSFQVITGGLSVSDLVIYKGLGRLQPGVPVDVTVEPIPYPDKPATQQPPTPPPTP